MRIGEVARRSGVSVRSLRYYEQQGLIRSGRTSGGHREFDDAVVDRVAFVQCMLTAGLPSRVIVDIMPFLDTGVATPVMLGLLQEEYDRVQRQLQELLVARDRLADLVATASSPSSAAARHLTS